MKTMMKTAILSLSLLTALTACQPKTDNDKIVAEQSMTSDALTESAEQLITPYNFPLADRALDMALANNPNNKKAEFLKVFLKRLTVFKGILTRILPLADANGNGANLRDSIKRLPNSPLKTFLTSTSGKADIKNAGDVQTFLVEYREAVGELRTYVKKNPGLDFYVNLNPSIFEQQIMDNYKDTCVVTDTIVCDTVHALQVRLAYPDFAVLAQEAAGEVLFLSLYTSYSVAGLDSLFHDLEGHQVCETVTVNDPYGGSYQYTDCHSEPRVKMTTRQILERVEQTSSAGQLRSDNVLKSIQGIGADLSAAARYAMKYQDKLCPNPGSQLAQRPGYLFKKGLCIANATETEKQLAMFDDLISKVTVQKIEDANGNVVSANINALAPFNNPVLDIRNYFPATWSACDTPATLRDKSVGGYFPDQNGEQFLIKRCE